MSEDVWLTPGAAAYRAGVSVLTIRDWRLRRGLAWRQIPGGAYQYLQSSLDAVVAQRDTPMTDENQELAWER